MRRASLNPHASCNVHPSPRIVRSCGAGVRAAGQQHLNIHGAAAGGGAAVWGRGARARGAGRVGRRAARHAERAAVARGRARGRAGPGEVLPRPVFPLPVT